MATVAQIKKLILDAVGLQTPAGRLLFFLAISLLVYAAPFEWFASLSIWQRLGIPSPSIGLTRSYWLILHGDPYSAWQLNKLIYLVIGIGTPLLVRDIISLIQRKKVIG